MTEILEAEVRTEHQVWVAETDGIKHHAHFFASPETYPTREKAEQMAKRYNDEQVGWDKPLPHRRFYVRTATVTTAYAPETSEVCPGCGLTREEHNAESECNYYGNVPPERLHVPRSDMPDLCEYDDEDWPCAWARRHRPEEAGSWE